MLKMFTTLLLGCMIALPACGAHAETWQVKQGDVARITAALPKGKVSVEAFGKQWPWKRLEGGKVLAWVGVDLAAHPGSHPLKWHFTDTNGRATARRDTLEVVKGKFRISRIKVKKSMAVFNRKELTRIRADQASLRRTYTTHVDASPDIAFLHMPVEGEISTPFGAQRYVNGQPRSPHTGIDIAVPAGTPIRAPLAGRVLLVRSMYLNGNTVVIGHGHGLVSVYCHLQSIDVKSGQWVDTDSVIGQVGQTGRATGPHLHWGIRFENARITPLALLR